MLVFFVPLLLLELLCPEEILPGDLSKGFALKLPVKGATAGNQPRFQQRGSDRDVLLRLIEAIRNCSDAMANLEADVPKPADQVFELCREFLLRRGRKQYEEVHVRMRKQLAAAVPSNCKQRQCAWERLQLPDCPQRIVDGPAVPVQEPPRAAAEIEIHAKGSALRS